ncbi:MAG: hypothetical protein H6Q43_2231, partial [Deltaproteobacteria bacterium]|nr:hypothetical protein [Deltaproteobacteria bacterium]
MKKLLSMLAAIFITCLMILPAQASSDLDVFISNLNVQAQ